MSSQEFFPHYRQFAQLQAPDYLRQAYRLYPDYPVPLEVKRRANFEEWRSFGYDQVEKEGLGRTLATVDGYTVFTQVKNATESDYDIMFLCFPNGTNEIIHIPSYLPIHTLETFYSALSSGAHVIESEARQREDQLRRIYIHHHVGPNELNDHPFNISFPQLHMHVIGVTQRDLDQSQVDPSRLELIRQNNRNTFTDPTILIARDLMSHTMGIEAEIDYKTSSLILSKRPLNLDIPHEDLLLLRRLYHEWIQEWGKLGLAFSNFSYEPNTRDPLLPRQSIENFTGLYLQLFPFLSQESREILDYLARHVQPASSQKDSSYFYKGIAGSIGWTHDFDAGTTTLRFAPRTLVSGKKLGSGDGLYMGVKNKGAYLPDQSDRLSVQRSIFARIATVWSPPSFASAPPPRVETESPDTLSGAETKPFYTDIFFTNTHVFKGKNRFTPQEITQQYHNLKDTGLLLGYTPEFVQIENRVWEKDLLVGDTNGAEFLQQVDDATSLSFFDQVILSAIEKLFVSQPGPVLEFSIDAIPHNFVWDESDRSFRYIDYEPSHLDPKHDHFLIPFRLLNYALVKFCREKPHLFDEALTLLQSRFPHYTTGQAFLGQAHLLVHQAAELELNNMLGDRILHKDEVLGLLIVFANRIDFSLPEMKLKLKKLADYEILSSTKNDACDEVVSYLAYNIGKSHPDRLKQILWELVSAQ